VLFDAIYPDSINIARSIVDRGEKDIFHLCAMLPKPRIESDA
jgi:hypothetical protein